MHFRSGCAIKFRTGNKGREVTNHVMEVTGEVRTRLLQRGRIFIGLRACRVEDFKGVSRCYRCQRFGHIQARCRGEKRCGHCGAEGHEYRECPRKGEKAICVNCKDMGREYGHETRDRQCPEYRRAVERIANITEYGWEGNHVEGRKN